MDADRWGRGALPMKRRRFAWRLLGLAGVAALTTPRLAGAQGGPIEGRQYVRLAQPLGVGAPAGQFEVIEFFWYGCPHCNAFEPALDGWVRQLPADVAFRRVPVAFRAEPYVAHQRLYYAIESLGLVPALHRKVFLAIHQQRMRLDNPAEIEAFMTRNGVDASRFMAAYDSFGIQARLRQANQLVDGYAIDGVPAMGVHGRFYTSGARAGDNPRMLQVTDFLLERLRNKG